MCKIKGAIINEVCRWLPKEKKADATMEKSICLMISVFKWLRKKTITKDQNKGLKISQETRIKEEGRKCVNKQHRGPNKIRHHPPIYNRSSSYSTKRGKSLIVKYSGVQKEIKIIMQQGEK